MEIEDVFEFESGNVVVLGRLVETKKPIADASGLVELEAGETYNVTVVSTRMPGPRSEPSLMALTLDGLLTKVARKIRTGTGATLTFCIGSVET